MRVIFNSLEGEHTDTYASDNRDLKKTGTLSANQNFSGCPNG